MSITTCAPAAIGIARFIAAALDLVALFEVIPFDHDYPPWDVTPVGRTRRRSRRVYFRAPYVVTDGIGGLRLAGALLDEVGCSEPASGRAESARSHRHTYSQRSSTRDGHHRLDQASGARETVSAAREVAKTLGTLGTGAGCASMSPTRCLVR